VRRDGREETMRAPSKRAHARATLQGRSTKAFTANLRGKPRRLPGLPPEGDGLRDNGAAPGLGAQSGRRGDASKRFIRISQEVTLSWASRAEGSMSTTVVDRPKPATLREELTGLRRELEGPDPAGALHAMGTLFTLYLRARAADYEQRLQALERAVAAGRDTEEVARGE
jgi:hypothetical protein